MVIQDIILLWIRELFTRFYNIDSDSYKRTKNESWLKTNEWVIPYPLGYVCGGKHGLCFHHRLAKSFQQHSSSNSIEMGIFFVTVFLFVILARMVCSFCNGRLKEIH